MIVGLCESKTILKVGRVDYNMKGMGLIRRAQTEKVGG